MSLANVLADIARASIDWVWFPTLLWSLAAAPIVVWLHFAYRTSGSPISTRPLLQQLILALPVGLLIGGVLELAGQPASNLLALPEISLAPALSSAAVPAFNPATFILPAIGFLTCVVALVAVANLVGIVRTAVATTRVTTLLRTTADPALTRRSHELAARLGLRRLIPVATSAGTDVPFAAGWTKPVIVLPASLHDASDRDLAVLHELSHIRRRHAYARLLLYATRAVFWFHPLIRISVDRVATLHECECDYDVVASGTTARRAYADLLFRFGSAEAGAATNRAVTANIMCTSMYSHPVQLKQRIVAMQTTQSVSMSRFRVLSLAVLFAVVGLMACSEAAPPAADGEAEISAATNENEPLVIVDEMPTLVNGLDDIHYPTIAKKAGIEGKVVVQLVVDTDGKVESAVILRGIGAGCDEEALRSVLQSTWTPAVDNGKPVRAKLSVPVTFKLSDDA